MTAVRIERPDHPGAADPGPPGEYATSPLVEAVRSDARRFRSLLLGAQWWLPIDSQIKAFHGGLPNGTEYEFPPSTCWSTTYPSWPRNPGCSTGATQSRIAEVTTPPPTPTSTPGPRSVSP